MTKTTVIAKIEIIKGKEAEYLSLVAPLKEMTKTEAGNLTYKLYKEVDNTSEYIAYEEYVNQEAFKQHCSTKLFASFVEQVKPLLAKEMDIQIF
ncbi:MAG: putative quinol monooxygenase [Dysgonomonas sp.]|uniref:putative quinol monooxygenase n=1 Tax=Dysgonomonas sp. TaxID=1891233 RepID=UPI0039E51EBC